MLKAPTQRYNGYLLETTTELQSDFELCMMIVLSSRGSLSTRFWYCAVQPDEGLQMPITKTLAGRPKALRKPSP